MFKKDDCTLSREQIEEQAQSLLQQMTLQEKVWMLNGNWDPIGNAQKYQNMYNPTPIETNGCPRLGVSPIGFTDGPRGVVMGHSTCFPVSMARGASFDPDLEQRIGDVIGQEARAQGANYFGGVCINLLRHPSWGRSQETYGEDPFLLGEMGKALTEGVQAHNVIACVKHYAVNNIENSRFKVNVKADERTMREVYLPHFKKCIDAGAASVMGAYNRFNDDQCCESHFLLTEVLRDDWGFEGFAISDFVAGVRHTKKAIEAGLDIEMPMPIYYQRNLLEAVEDGSVAEAAVDTAVLRILRDSARLRKHAGEADLQHGSRRQQGTHRTGAGSRREIDGAAQECERRAAFLRRRSSAFWSPENWEIGRIPAMLVPARSTRPTS